MKIGILGGTFDPPHIGHLIMAEEAYARLGLDTVLFVPAKEPPHKKGRAYSPIADRLAMVGLAIEDNPHFSISLVDVNRFGPSYSVDTVRLLQEEYGSEAELFFIVGLDSVADLLSWREPAKLLASCQMVAVGRPEYLSFDLRDLSSELPDAERKITIIESPLIGISSSEIRRRVGHGLPVKYQVVKNVERYIIDNHLYLTT